MNSTTYVGKIKTLPHKDVKNIDASTMHLGVLAGYDG
jgi:hypothetical protein